MAEPSEGRKWQRLIRAVVREACEPWRIQAQAGPVTERQLEAIINRAAVPILSSMQEQRTELVKALVPSLVRVMLAAAVEVMAEERRPGGAEAPLDNTERMPPFDPLSIDMMHATLVARPFHREGWVYEEKYDGWRMLARKRGIQVQLVSRAGRDHTRRFPALVAAVAKLAPDALVLDGEVCIFDQQLVSRFEWLREQPKDETATPPIFMAFDCLWLADRDLREQTLGTRRDRLEEVLDGQDVLLPARRLADDGLKAWAQVLERGYEGLVAKDAASPYHGGRTLAWLKVKVPKYREGERGWEPKG